MHVEVGCRFWGTPEGHHKHQVVAVSVMALPHDTWGWNDSTVNNGGRFFFVCCKCHDTEDGDEEVQSPEEESLWACFVVFAVISMGCRSGEENAMQSHHVCGTFEAVPDPN